MIVSFLWTIRCEEEKSILQKLNPTIFELNTAFLVYFNEIQKKHVFKWWFTNSNINVKNEHTFNEVSKEVMQQMK